MSHYGETSLWNLAVINVSADISEA